MFLGVLLNSVSGNGSVSTCQYSTAIVTGSGGSGSWTALSTNPVATVIDSPGVNRTLITGFTVAGTYGYVWTSGAAPDTIRVTVIAKPNAGPNETVSCFNTGTATMAAVGVGTWSQYPLNPGNSVIVSPSSPTTTITGFSVPGNYRYIWTVNGCTDTTFVVAGSQSNDNCTGATSLGTLPAPASCSGSSGINWGTTTSLTGQSNLCASPEIPYPYQLLCPVNLANPPRDVWYSFVASATRATISVSGATFSNPVINLWGGTCYSLSGLGCITGLSGSASITVYQLTVGATYYIQVSGEDSTQAGTFNISAQASTDCAACLVTSYITSSPSPSLGSYAPGERVQFCYHVTSWNQTSANWLHGIQVTWGGGWDSSSLTVDSIPGSCAGDGFWAWYHGDTSSATGAIFGQGFYFLTASGRSGSVDSLNCGNNYGDNDPSNTCTWNFCVGLRVGADSCGTTNPALQDLNVTFYSSGDGESGSWGSFACSGDPSVTTYNILACCPPILTTTVAPCGHPDGTATVRPRGNRGPWKIQWSTGLVVYGVTDSTTITGLAPGLYTVSVTDINDCVSTASDSVRIGLQPDGGVPKYASCVTVDTVRMTAIGQGTWSALGSNPASTIIYSPDSSNTVIGGLTTPGTYNYVWAIGVCYDTVPVYVTIKPNAGPDVYTCVNGTATMAAVGVGTWSPMPGNPAATVIANPNSPTTTISGFSVGGTYNFIWSFSTCTDTASVIIPPFTSSASILNSTLCKYQTTTLTATGSPSGLGPFTYNWSPAAGVVSPAAGVTQTQPVLAPTTYYVTVSTSGGCQLIDSVHLNVRGAAPRIEATALQNGVCPGDTVTIVSTAFAENLVLCGTTSTLPAAATSISSACPGPIGPSDTSTSTGAPGYTTVYCSPFSGGYSSYKVQYLFRRSELNAAGLSSGTLSGISFYVKQVNSTIPYDTFSVSMGCTNADSLTDFIGGLQTVVPPLMGSSAYFPNVGWSPLPFTNYYNWDGASNIVIQICYTLPNTFSSNDDFVSYTTTPYNGSSIYTGDYYFFNPGNGCNLGYASTFYYGINNTRPTVLFNESVPNVLTSAWTPAAAVTCPTCDTTKVVVDSSMTVTLTVADSGCSNDTAIRLYINPHISLLATAGTTPDTTLCSASAVQLHESVINPASSGCVAGYSVDTIPYSVISGTATAIPPVDFINSFGTTHSTDDGVAGPFSIGFNFPFYCHNYTQFYVNSNAWVTFQNPYAGGIADGSWEYTAQPMPPSSIPPYRAIELLMGHYYLANGYGTGRGNVKYFVSGTAPNRILVLQFNNMEDDALNGTTTAGEMHLYEGSGLIDVLLTSSNYSADPHTTGVVDSIGFGTPAPGINDQFYTTTTHKAWRFTPQNGPSVIQTGVVWTPNISLSNDTIANPLATPSSSQTYVVHSSYVINQFTNPEPCVVTDTVHVNISPFQATASASPLIICPGDSAQLNLHSDSVIASVAWSPASLLSDSAIADPYARITDTTQFIARVSNAGGCVVMDTITVNTYPVLHPVIGPGQTVCYSDSVKLSLPAGAFANYQWFSVDSATGARTLLSSGPADSTFYAHPQGYYVLEVTTAAGAACSYFSNMVSVDSFPLPVATVDTNGFTTFCQGQNVVLSVNPGFNNIHWTPSGFGTQSSITVSTSGIYFYSATDAHNCLVHSNAQSVTVNPIPVFAVSNYKSPICAGASDTITIGTSPAGGSVNWTYAGNQTSGNVIVARDSGSYSIQANVAGCIGDTTILLGVAPNPTVSLGPDVTSCNCNPAYVLSPVVSPSAIGNTFMWSDSTRGNTDTDFATGFRIYTLTVTDANGCTGTAHVGLTFNCPIVNLEVDPASDTIFRNDTAVLYAVHASGTVATSYVWGPAAFTVAALGDSVHAIGFQSGKDTFWVIATDATGCTDTVSMVLNVLDSGGFTFADAFTPNGDVYNPTFYPSLLGGNNSPAKVVAFRIYNRWGQMVFDNPNRPGWDGTYGGKPQPTGTYLYFATFEFPDPSNASKTVQKSVQGSFQLFR